MKITIYELLGMIKDGKVPKRIIYDEYVYVWNSKIENYQREVDEITTLNWDYIAINCLNDEVEILDKSEEEKKIPEKIKIDNEDRIQALSTGNFVYKVNQPTKNIIYKINEIIDCLDYLKSKGE